MSSKQRSGAPRGFSLVEVVLAVGIFALAIVAILGLLSPVTRQTGEVLDSSTATRLAEIIQAELERAGGGAVLTATAGNAPLFLTAPVDGSRVLLTGVDGSGQLTQLAAAEASLNGPAPGIAQRERYFLIEIRRLASGGDLAYTTGDGAVALAVRVSWPYFLPTGPPPETLPGAWNDISVAGRLVPTERRSVYFLPIALRL